MSIETARGEIEGIVDVRTDDRTLWIREEEGHISLTSAVAWDQVQRALIDGHEVETATLFADYPELATESPDLADAPALPATVLPPSSTSKLPSRLPRVRNLEIVDARIVNLDRDVEPDGLEFVISAATVDGVCRAVRGNLVVELIGERRPRDTGAYDVATLDQWSVTVRESDFIDGVAVFTLPFRAFSPEWEFDVPPDAILTANLSAHGEGNFSASAPVVLQQFSPMRDNLQLFRSSRLAPGELTSGKPLSRFGVQQGRWHYWPR